MRSGGKKIAAHTEEKQGRQHTTENEITAEKLLWTFEKDEKTGNVTIIPMNGKQIVIHGKTEAETFCGVLTQCFR